MMRRQYSNGLIEVFFFCYLIDHFVSVDYHMVLHLPEQILNWSPPKAWRPFTHERRTGELSDTLTSGKSVEENCADHLPLPVIPETIHTQIQAAITHLLETPDSIPEIIIFIN